MAEGRDRLAGEAAQEAAKIASASQPNARPATIAAAQQSRLGGACDDVLAVRLAAQQGFVNNLHQVDESHVPQPDAPPIIYPDTETWKDLTARRKERYGAAELSQLSPAEKKIDDALKQPTQIEFIETPLKDVIDYLKDLHHIEIQFDGPALKDLSIDENTPITRSLKGISLRSALRLLLDDLQLKCVIHNEVLLITSAAKTEGDEYIISKVYPVADVVLPIKETGFKGGFGPMGGGSLLGGGQSGGGNPMQNGNPPQNGSMPFGNPMQNGNNMNPFGNGNQQMGNNMFNIPREFLRGN
jgi:hypothetical protein